MYRFLSGILSVSLNVHTISLCIVFSLKFTYFLFFYPLFLCFGFYSIFKTPCFLGLVLMCKHANLFKKFVLFFYYFALSYLYLYFSLKKKVLPCLSAKENMMPTNLKRFWSLILACKYTFFLFAFVIEQL